MTSVSISEEIRQFWDEDAAVYDNSPEHHPRRPQERAAWSGTLRRLLPDPPARVLDAGAGTGFLSLLLAGQGYQVTAMDLSSRMLEVLQDKAAHLGLEVQTAQADAVSPPDGPFDAVVERHLLWTLPDPGAALAAWREAAPTGRLVLIEGTWGQASGVAALQAEARALARRVRGAESGHHGHYTDRVASTLPHANGITPADVVALVQASPWGQARLERLRDVEWAALDGRSLLDQLLGTNPRWAVTAGS
jgi:ubiquinone/menaquinone biosynthesis C-methylase UbiE